MIVPQKPLSVNSGKAQWKGGGGGGGGGRHGFEWKLEKKKEKKIRDISGVDKTV